MGIANWDNTLISRIRLEDKLEDGKYMGRPLIRRDSSVLGGIYVGANEREAVVVDRKYGELNKLYEKAKERATVNGIFRKDLILKCVFQVVSEAMPNQDDKTVDRMVRAMGAKKDCKVALDVFLQNKTGTCRHDALACAALLEMFGKEGLIRGKANVDRNATPIIGSHAWCRYTNSGNQVYILDVKNKFIGSLEEAMERKLYPYNRHEDGYD